MRIMIKISRKILLMKKRILSLFLALAMVATAGVAVPGIQAEAAGRLGYYISDAGVKAAIADGDVNVKVKTSTGKDRAGKVQVGDVLSVENLGSSKIKLNVVDLRYTDEYDIASDENVNVTWVKSKKGGTDVAPTYGDWSVAGEGLEYTVVGDDVDYAFMPILWVPSSDPGDAYHVEEFDDIYKNVSGTTKGKLNDFVDTISGGGIINALAGTTWTTRNSITTTGTAVGLTLLAVGNDADGKVNRTIAKADSVVLSGRVYDDGSEILMVGNTLIVPSNKVSSISNAAITFSPNGDINAKALWGKKGNDDKDGKSGDPLFWTLSKQNSNGNSNAPVKPSRDGRGFNNWNGNVKDVYDIWVFADEQGDAYDATKGVQTKYSMVIVSGVTDNSGNTGVLIALDLQGGNLPAAISERYGFTQYNVKNAEMSNTDKIAVRAVLKTQNNAPEEQKMYDLPTLPKKGEEFFQGWSNSTKGDILPQVSDLATRYDKTYFAVWGDTEVKNTTTVGGKALYRLYNPNNGEHLYTPNKSEVDGLTPLGWIEESTTFNGLAEGGTMVNRLYNPNSGEHHYVLEGSNEEKVLLGAGWLSDGGVFRSGTLSGTTPVYLYSLWNGQAGPGSHHLTNDVVEYNTLATQGWKQEGVKFSGVK